MVTDGTAKRLLKQRANLLKQWRKHNSVWKKAQKKMSKIALSGTIDRERNKNASKRRSRGLIATGAQLARDNTRKKIAKIDKRLKEIGAAVPAGDASNPWMNEAEFEYLE